LTFRNPNHLDTQRPETDESYWASVPPGRITADEARLKKKGSSDPLVSPHAHALALEPASAWRHMEEELWPSSRFYHRK